MATQLSPVINGTMAGKLEGQSYPLFFRASRVGLLTGNRREFHVFAGSLTFHEGGPLYCQGAMPWQMKVRILLIRYSHYLGRFGWQAPQR